ncbi:hypothetical protein FACS1894208_01440 [Clostridia bacterium]|nr:hypothetical protein FACS1894208_01440 [Clostridia bacterium]
MPRSPASVTRAVQQMAAVKGMTVAEIERYMLTLGEVSAELAAHYLSGGVVGGATASNVRAMMEEFPLLFGPCGGNAHIIPERLIAYKRGTLPMYLWADARAAG